MDAKFQKLINYFRAQLFVVLKVERPITFRSEGFKIRGDIRTLDRNAPCIVMLHGFTANKDLNFWKKIATGFVKSEYSCLSFNFRGCGEGDQKSEGKFENTTLTDRIQDYKAAMNFLREGDILSPDSIGVFGHSLGGMVAICSKDQRAESVVTMGTPFQVPRYGEPKLPERDGEYYKLPSGRKFKKQFYSDMKRYDTKECIKEISPVRIIHGSCDEIVPLTHAKELYDNANQPKSLEIVYNANHLFSNRNNLSKAISLSIEWFDKYLKD